MAGISVSTPGGTQTFETTTATYGGKVGGGPRRLRGVLALEDFEALARKHLPRPILDYVAGAAETNFSLKDNRAAFADYGFVTRVLSDVSKRSQATELFGKTYATSFGIAPMGLSALVAYQGDIALARASAQRNIPMIVSGSALTRLEDVREVAPDAWFQAYLPGDPVKIAALVQRVANAGYETLVLTVDTATRANRENNIRAGFATPLRPSLRLAWDGVIRPRWTIGTFLRTLVKHGVPHFENSFSTRGAPIISRNVERDFSMRDHLNWSHLREIRRQWKGNLVVKGIMGTEDAKVARAEGAQGIIVSNHGGRQLDGTVSPLRVLERVASVAGDMTVMMDGGIRRGTDVLKARALGARFVFVGRPFLCAAAIAGEVGVRHAIDTLSNEITRNMALIGINSLDEMSRDFLVPVRQQQV
ncbi:alpha-hydroxy-acid oxidizing enzyme [Agaricicola taiwanensis]|uniref:Alpha-hydroxy-acid oxidizing enzyme n=1 Tax=Agaricicola taiwanensis TaxID=591372 RepID=A0A8J2YHL4_9RHOB|nr:alpha-hydroxy acid oxidase [Agaricicola taiwanensis]GGE43410.1 alpha-hydroxy-acid oxidizing enzyme [Agaricicola taiwanensis]